MTLLVPYRDREEHLKEFIPAMKQHDIYIIEQADDKPFNRGKLINVGFLEVKPSVFVAHDIDMIDISVDYDRRKLNSVTQFAKSEIQKTHYLGGVTCYPDQVFMDVHGYHNDYWHRAEDNEMSFNLYRKFIAVFNRPGTFKQLPHPRPAIEFDPVLWQKAQAPRTKDMLKTCQYELISKQAKDGYTHLRVLL